MEIENLCGGRNPMTNLSKDHQRKPAVGWRFWLVVVGLGAAAFASITVVYSIGIKHDQLYKALGPWGDFVGGTLNPILTFLTFIGVLSTIILQKEELSLTRDELNRSATALESQNDSIKKQNFEATFFHMLNLHNQIVGQIDLVHKDTGIITTGRDCFASFYTRLNKIYRENKEKANSKYEDRNVLALSYHLFWKTAQNDLGHYYRFLFNMIKMVDESMIGDDFYIKLIRSQISDTELLLLFYNCTTKNGEKFKFYAEKYALFDNMPSVRLFEKNHRNWLADEAFGDADPNEGRFFTV